VRTKAPNPVGAARAQELRIPQLHRRRDVKMARDAHAYVRGSTERFYEWLTTTQGRAIPQGPIVWICGDAHVGNLGPIARGDAQIEVELRDLDQTVPGNPAHDLVRLALSLAMGARSSDLPGVVTARLVEELMRGYLEAFDNPGNTAPSMDSAAVRFVLREAVRRKWRHLQRERIGKKPRFPLGDRFLPLVDEERDAVARFLDKERVRRLVTQLDCRDDDAQIRLLDAAYWVKGCSSLGLWRCAALIGVVGKNEIKGGYALLDLKEAVETVAPIAGTDQLPTHQGERVVRGAQALSPTLGKRMLAGTILNRPVFVRELMPQDLKLELEMMDDTEARATARALARILGLAHVRQMDEPTRAQWQAELADAGTRSMDAPPWLWSSVVDLIGIHERAYLEHCRRYVLDLEKSRERAVQDMVR